jgi:N-ethylmaleimide reductase
MKACAMSANAALFDSYQLGKLTLPNRLVMAPLTRNRATRGLTPSSLAPKYYGQRASAGIIITEATQVSPDGQGYQDTPGIYSAQQINGWRKVTDAVHTMNGRIFLQIWHVGRISHARFQPNGQAPVAPSAIRAKAKSFIGGEFVDVAQPRALLRNELPRIVDNFRQAARNAIDAGFDGVEVHGANGYLLDQFLRDSSNKRTDDYGGSIQNRARLLLEVSKAIAEEIGRERTGVRLSPVTPYNDMSDSDPQALFDYVAGQLSELRLVYIHVVEGATGGPRDFLQMDYGALRRRFKGTYIANNGYNFELAKEAIASGRADLVSFGKLFIANPDLVERFRTHAPLNEPDPATFYGGNEKGYIDYPALEAVPAE